MSRISKMQIAGWVLSVLLSAFLIIASASAKFTEWEGKEEMFANMGWNENTMFYVGVVEVAIAILILIPRTSFVAAILLAAYLGGATATHVRLDEPFYMPILVGVVAWIGVGLRRPEIFQLAIGQRIGATSDGDSSDEKAES